MSNPPIRNDVAQSGPIKFLGATVLSFNSSLGWGSTSSTLTVDVIEDCTSIPPDCFEINNNCPPPTSVGQAAYFKAGNFEFGGIIQSYSRSRSSAGLIYKVQLTDPRDLLQNFVIVVDTYQDAPVGVTNNFLNVYNYWERKQCFNGSFGFGAAGVSSQGMSVDKIRIAFTDLDPVVVHSPTGQQFFVDLSALNFVYPPFYRVTGPSITLLELIQNICDTYGFDFYVYLESNGGVNSGTIRVGLVDLKNEPNLTSIQNYINSQGNTIIDSSIGRELRNDITKTVIIGEKRHTLYRSELFNPFFGEEYNSNTGRMDPIIPYHYEGLTGNGFWIFKDVSSIGLDGLFGKLQISELDIRMAMSGFKSWYNWVFFHGAPGSFNDALRSVYQNAVANTNYRQIIEALQLAQAPVNNVDPAQGGARAEKGQDNFIKARNDANKDINIRELEIAHSWLSSLGNTYYGKQYLAVIPAGVCTIIGGGENLENVGAYKFSAEPTNSGGWWEPSNPLDTTPLEIGSNNLNYFRNDDGRITGFARFVPGENNFAESLSIENLSDEDYIIEGSYLYVKFDIEEKIFPYFAPGSTGVAIPYVLIKFSNMVVQNPSVIYGEDQFPRSLLWSYASNPKNYKDIPNPGGNATSAPTAHSKTIPIFKESVANSLFQNKGAWGASSLNDRGFCAAAVNPLDCVIPMKSNIDVYGPWGSTNFIGLPENCGTNNYGLYGGTEVISDPDMAPWNFGSIESMNSVGCELVNSSNIGLTQAENGSFTAVGLPNLGTLGSAIVSTGPSLTGVNTSFGSNGVTTSYEFKTFTPKFGKLSKLFSDRLKQQAKARLQNLKFIRAQMSETNRLNKKISQIANARINNSLGSDARKASPANILTSKMSDWYNLDNNQKSQVTDVGLETSASVINEMAYDYDKKAFVSLEAIFGPVSIKGDGDLPRYIEIDSIDEAVRLHKSSPIYAQPPFYKKENEEEDKNHDLYNLNIKNLYLNPLSNPNEIPHVSGSQHKGHSIDVVGRGEELPEKGLMGCFYNPDDNAKYSEDYRFLGMRGPIVLQSWGYDVDGKPIPNAADNDNDAKSGKFTNEKLKDQFLKDWLQKSKTWPVGPIDLRFDRNRGVWVSPQPHRIVVAKLTEDLAEFGSAKAKIINNYNNKDYGDKLYDNEGEEIKAGEDDSEAYINVVDRVGKTFKEDSLIYVYYDAYLSEYIILSGESSDETIVRFKLIEACDHGTTTPTYGDEWTEKNGFGDKRFGEDNLPDSYAVRINCNGQPIKKDGTPLSDNELSNISDYGEHLIIVKDSVGQWGPSFNSILDITKWKQRAACGYGVIISDPKPSGVESSPEDPPQCSTNLACSITYTNEDDEEIEVDKIYEILYLESYARIIYGELTQDLYCSEEKASTEYSNDDWKKDNPKGNASISISKLKFFGNSDNGSEPIYLNREEEEIEVRVFDPFFDENRLDDSPFSELVEGSRVIAIFNEKLKKYEIIQADKKESSSVIRFKLFELCESSSDYSHQDSWQQYAGYGDKLSDNHILGIRINCDGLPINKQGEEISDQEINEALNGDGEDIFVNLYDTCGKHGPAFAFYKTFADWKSNAFTGFAAKIPASSGNITSCQGMGLSNQCSLPESKYDNYDIMFLESYARFVECTLQQDLYPSDEKQQSYNGDSYKSEHKDGNAKAEINQFYGGSPNDKEPKFYDNSISEVPFRVFDPYEDIEKNKNPFSKLKEGDKVLAVFNEKLKKYIIFSAGNDKENSKVVKFALVDDKKSSQLTARAVLINYDGIPIDKEGELLTPANFNSNFITVNDPFFNRNSSMSYASGPAIGSDNFDEHINGISDLNGAKPFIGFALEIVEPSGDSQGSGSSNSNKYEIITLERFAQYVTGIVGVIKEEEGYYYGAMTSFWDGRHPLTKSTKNFTKGLNLKLKYNISPVNGEHSFIMGDFEEGKSAGSSGETFQSLAAKIDGCKFIAKLSDTQSFNNSSQDLIYHIVESEHVALFGSSVIKNQTEIADQLNNGEQIEEDDSNSKLQSSYTNGFQWNKNVSAQNYKKIKIENRNDWINKGYLVKGSHIYFKLNELSEQGPIYRIYEGGTIAEVTEKKATDGKWGAGQSSGQESYDGGKFYQGVSPSQLSDEDGGKPQIDPLVAFGPWMTYQNSPTVSLWDETAGTVGGAKNYRLIYAREAPVIITGKAVGEGFKPSKTSDISVSISTVYSSCPNVGNNPITTLLTKVKNPLGYGAKGDDFVTLQRVFSSTIENEANYYYIVIGTGRPPETC